MTTTTQPTLTSLRREAEALSIQLRVTERFAQDARGSELRSFERQIGQLRGQLVICAQAMGRCCEVCGAAGAVEVSAYEYVGGRGYQPSTRLLCAEYEPCAARSRAALEAVR